MPLFPVLSSDVSSEICRQAPARMGALSRKAAGGIAHAPARLIQVRVRGRHRALISAVLISRRIPCK